jgi:Spy/CpxP family protein refolding chaperone
MRLWFKRTLAGAAAHGGPAAFSLAAQAWHHGRHGWGGTDDEAPGRWRERVVERVAHRLGLDDEQRERFALLYERLRELRQALRGRSDLRKDVASLVQDGAFDRWYAQDLVNARIQALRDKSPLVISAMAEFYDALRPAQQQKVRDLLARTPSGWGWNA